MKPKSLLLLPTFASCLFNSVSLGSWRRRLSAGNRSLVVLLALMVPASALAQGNVLLTTITNPTPAVNDYFGWAVAGVGKDRVLIGGVWDDTGAMDSGSAYLFALPYPPLSIARDADAVSVGWVTAEAGLTLQQADLLGSSAVWSDTTNSVSVIGLTNVVQQPLASAPTNRFYRLRRP